MNGRKTVFGVALLLALVSGALGASNSSADTAYECEEQVTSVWEWEDEHCLSGAEGGGSFKHVEIPPNTATEITITNANTVEGTTAASTAKLKGVAGGFETEFQCTTASGTGSVENKKEGATTWAQLTGVINYSGCSVLKPAGKGCILNGHELTTKTLAASTKGLTAQLKFEPASGTEFASITIESCSVAGLNKTFPTTGSFIVGTSGATLAAIHAQLTAQGNLKFAGQKAGIEGALTLTATATEAGLVST